MNAIRGVTAAAKPAGEPADRLKKTASRLEGVFVNQLFKAMRDTVPQNDADNTGGGEQMFTSMFDQELADRAPAQWQHGLGGAIVRALGPHIPKPEHR